MFKKITLKDKEIYDKYIEKNNFFSCEYSFATIFMWRNFNKIEYDIINDLFIMKKYDKDIGYFFMEPLGKLNDNILKNLVISLKCSENKEDNSWLFGNITERFLLRLNTIFNGNLIFEEEKDKFDYIYDFNELKTLKGNKFRKKKNKYNQFIRNYNYKTIILKKSLDDYEKDKCYKFLEKWYLENLNQDGEFLAELEGTKELIKYLGELELDLIELYVDEELIGISIGESFSDNMYIIHVEKCLKEFNGAYAFINNTFINNTFLKVKYINREEDLGISGLRKAKMSYNPKFFEKKYLVKIK